MTLQGRRLTDMNLIKWSKGTSLVMGRNTCHLGGVQWREYRAVSPMPKLNIIVKKHQPDSEWGTLTDLQKCHERLVTKGLFPGEGSKRNTTRKCNMWDQPGCFCCKGDYRDNWQNLKGVWGLDDGDKSISVSRFWWLSWDYRRMPLFVRNPH